MFNHIRRYIPLVVLCFSGSVIGADILPLKNTVRYRKTFEIIWKVKCQRRHKFAPGRGNVMRHWTPIFCTTEGTQASMCLSAFHSQVAVRLTGLLMVSKCLGIADSFYLLSVWLRRIFSSNCFHYVSLYRRFLPTEAKISVATSEALGEGCCLRSQLCRCWTFCATTAPLVHSACEPLSFSSCFPSSCPPQAFHGAISLWVHSTITPFFPFLTKSWGVLDWNQPVSPQPAPV